MHLRLHLSVPASRPPRAQETRSSPTRTGQGGGRLAPRAGSAPAPPASPPRLGSHLSPAPRAAASARLALRDSSPELWQSAGAPPFSPRDSASPCRFPPSPPPKPQLPSLAAPPGCNSRFPRTGAAVAAHKTALSAARGSARLGAGRADAAGGGDAAPPARRPPPARPRGPQGRRGYRLGSVTPSGAGCRRR